MRSQAIKIACTRQLNEELRRKAESEGFIIEDKEVIEVDYLSSDELIKTIEENCDPFVFTSGHAVRALNKLIQTRGLKLLSTDVCCIAGKTEELARNSGFEIMLKAANAMEMAEQIERLGNVGNLLHAGSNIGLDSWKIYLKERGIQVKTIEVYFKKLEPQVFGSHEAVMFFSPSQVDAYLSLNQLGDTLPAFCIGETTAQYLRGLNHKNIKVAATASEESLLKTVYHYYNV